jgi:hypothetical protein
MAFSETSYLPVEYISLFPPPWDSEESYSNTHPIWRNQ